MSAGWRPMRRRSEHKDVGRDVRGRPPNVAASVSAKWWSIALWAGASLGRRSTRPNNRHLAVMMDSLMGRLWQRW